MEGVLPGDELQLLLQAEIEASADGLSCQKVMELLQSRAEGDQPLSFMYTELGDGLRTMPMTTPDACTRIWLPHVRERGQALAVAIATTMITHQTECRRAYREQYAADGMAEERADDAQTPLQRELARWIAEDPSRAHWPRDMPKFQRPENREEFDEKYGVYEELVGQYEAYQRARQEIQDRLDGKAEEEVPFVFPDEHRRLQVLDAVRQIVGGGMGHWILTNGPYGNFVPKDPANPSLSKLGWKAVFRACTPPEYFHLFLDRPFESVRGWADVLDSHLKALSKPRRATTTKQKVLPVSKVRKDPRRPSSTSAGPTRTTNHPVTNLRYDPSVGVERHHLPTPAYQQFQKQGSRIAKLQWLVNHLPSADVPADTKATAQAGYQRRLKEVREPESPKKSQTSFRERSRRSGERKDYSWRGQQKRHEGGVHAVEHVDSSEDEKRPATPYPERYQEDSDSFPDTAPFDFMENREYTDPSDDERPTVQLWHRPAGGDPLWSSPPQNQ
jgi:hypothetical protein